MFTILVVEDNTRYLEIYRNELAHELECDVVAAQTGEEALVYAEGDGELDLVLLDLTLPGIGGEEVLTKLRASKRHEDVPVIIFSGESSSDRQCQLLELGADDFIEKGLPPALMYARIRAQLRRKMAIDKMSELAMEAEIFTCGVLHDIRNIEAGAASLCELIEIQLADMGVDQESHAFRNVLQLKEQVAKMDRYASGVIDRVRGVHSDAQVGAVDPRRLIEWVQNLLSGGVSQPSGNTIEIDFGDAPLQPVAADEQLLRLAFLNIVQNATKYARDDDPPKLVVGQEAGPNSNCWVITFRDNGCGIGEEDLGRVFDPFVRGHRRGKQAGYGLGLSMVRRVVRKMHGEVWAEIPNDGMGPGALIKVRLPKS